MKSHSRPNDFSHNIKIDGKGLIKCESNCPRYNADGFCSHAIAVSLQTKSLKNMLVFFQNVRKEILQL